jgi:hypothetical protein
MGQLARNIALLIVLALTACQRAEDKSLVERLYEARVKRCESMMPKGEESRCAEHPDGTTYQEAGNRVHKLMVDQVAKTFPMRGSCVMYGYVYLVCTETTGVSGDRQHGKVYKLADASDGSDSRTIFLWSEEW